jgi:hypothetical protein
MEAPVAEGQKALAQLAQLAEPEGCLVAAVAVAEWRTLALEAQVEQGDALKSECGCTDEWTNSKKPSRTIRSGRTESRLPAVHWVCPVHEAR